MCEPVGESYAHSGSRMSEQERTIQVRYGFCADMLDPPLAIRAEAIKAQAVPFLVDLIEKARRAHATPSIRMAAVDPLVQDAPLGCRAVFLPRFPRHG